MDMIMAVVAMLAILCVYGAYESRLKHLERMNGVRGKGHPEFLVFHQLGTGAEVSLQRDAIKGFTQMEKWCRDRALPLRADARGQGNLRRGRREILTCRNI